MPQGAAHRVIDRSLLHAFDESAFRKLTGNLLSEVQEEDAPPRTGVYIYDAFSDHVASYKRIAKYADPEGEELDVLVVKLRRYGSLDRARTMQRNFVAEYLKRKERSAALVAYHTDESTEWRLSLVRLEYRTVQDEESGKVKTEEDLTPARRFSFLVGEGEPSHTARKQLLPLVRSDTSPTLDDLDAAFDIEVVTEDFFEDYKGHFLAIRKNLDDLTERHPKIKQTFAACDIDTATFAKKLLGQIVFLYFLQKKGWLGVSRAEGDGLKAWGDGPKDFMRRLFEQEYTNYSNFFNDCLEPLFYEALATERGTRAYYSRFDCRIPFLNGGLFEPVGDYPWEAVDIPIDDALFAAVFDTFDRYNFTVREDEPLEKEVAIDPEMLGKVFEKLLGKKQKKLGAFYTPREIVHYMCQETLIDYLAGALTTTRKQPLARQEAAQADAFRGVPPPQGSLMTDEEHAAVPRKDLAALVRAGEGFVEHDRRVERAGRETDTYGYKLPDAIRRNARIIDEALAGIKICDPAIGSGAFPVGMMQEVARARQTLSTYLPTGEERTAYHFKRHAIQHSLYGVDLDGSAVDIARLRLWLSLVVDEDDFAHIQPLPNLRYRIVQGDALGGVARDVFNNTAEARLHRLIEEHIPTSNPRRKKALQTEIDALITDLTGGGDRFDFRIYFSEVFQENGGFDVVIGNPPYGAVTDEQAKEQYKDKYQTTEGRVYAYELFLEKSVELCRKAGIGSLIIPSPILTNYYTRKLRLFLKKRTSLTRIDNFGDGVFNDPTVHNCVIFFRHDTGKNNTVKVSKEVGTKGNLFDYDYKIDQERIFRGPRSTIDVFIDPKTSEIFDSLSSESINLGEICHVRQCIKTGNDDKYVKKFCSPPGDPWKPTLKGRSIERYLVNDRKLYVKYGSHLSRNWKNKSFYERPKIVIREASSTPIATLDEEHAYILSSLYSVYLKSDHNGVDLRYILAIINSKVAKYCLQAIALSITKGAFSKLKANQLKRLPVYVIDENNTADVHSRDALVKCVDKILDLRKQQAARGANGQASDLQQQIAATDDEIDRLVYALYGLTEAEIAIVDEATRPA